jgi:integrase
VARRSKRPDGRYERKVTVANGKRVSVYAETAALADQEAEKMRKKIAQGIDPLSERVPLGEYLQYWMDTIITPRRKPKTVRNYSQMIAHIPARLKAMPLPDLKPEVLRAFVVELERQPLAAATKRNVFAVLRSALNQAWRDSRIEHNHIARIEPPRAVDVEVQPLTPDQARALLELAKGDGQWAGPIVTGLCLGLRMGEVLGLLLDDLDLEAGTLRIDKQLQRYGKNKLALEETKQRAKRTVKLPLTVRDVLKEHVQLREETRKLAASAWRGPIKVMDGRQVEFLFTTTIGTPHFDTNLRRRLRALLALAGVKRHRFHDLRHTAATMLIAAGVNPKAVQHFMGWKDSRMVDRYTHAVAEVMSETAEAMERALSAPKAGRPTSQAPAWKH